MEQFCHTLPTSTAFENTSMANLKTVGVIRYTVPEIQTRALSVYVSNTPERSTKRSKLQGGTSYPKGGQRILG